MMQATEVEARFSAKGKISLLSFKWQGQRRAVTSRGRQWNADDGLHFLVLDASEQVFELLYAPASGLWHIVRAPRDDSTAA